MAATYIDEMLGMQPAGPFFLLGYSLGGLIAYEVARQLRAHGHEIGLLGMIDTSPESTLGESTEYAIPLLIRYGLRLDADIGEMLTLDADTRNEKLLRMGVEAGTLPRDYGLPKLRRMLELYEVNGRAQAAYRVRPLAETIVLFRSDEPGPPSLGWDRYVPEVAVVLSPGDHFQILEPGSVTVIAQEVACRVSARVPAAGTA
jgi:thioesterase domain-containing protein